MSGLLGTSTSLAGLFDALPRLLADGLGLAGVAIRLDPEPVRPLAVHDDDDPFSSAIRNAPLVLAPAVSGGLAFRPSPAVRRLGSLSGGEGNLYGAEIPTTEEPSGVLYLGSVRPISAAVEQLALDVAAVLGELVSRERRERQLRQRIQAREEALGIVARKGDEGRPGEVPRRRRLRLPGQAGEHRPAPGHAPDLAAPLKARAARTVRRC